MAPHAEQLTEPAVRISELTRAFGDRTVLDGVGLDIPPGQFVALLGHSGSGKSTLLRPSPASTTTSKAPASWRPRPGSRSSSRTPACCPGSGSRTAAAKTMP